VQNPIISIWPAKAVLNCSYSRTTVPTLSWMNWHWSRVACQGGQHTCCSSVPLYKAHARIKLCRWRVKRSGTLVLNYVCGYIVPSQELRELPVQDDRPTIELWNPLFTWPATDCSHAV
jgi:hypothetical protein